MAGLSFKDSNAPDLLSDSSEYLQHRAVKSLQNDSFSAGVSYDKFDIYEPLERNSGAVQRDEKLVNLCGRFSNVEADRPNIGYALLLGFIVIAFASITITNFFSDPTLFQLKFLRDANDETSNNTLFFVVLLLYILFVLGIVVVLFSLRQYLPKCISIGFKIASYGLILFGSCKLFVSDPIAFSIVLTGIACIWLRKWFSFSLNIIENYLSDFVAMLRKFPRLTGLVFCGLVANSVLDGLLKMLIEITQINYGVKSFGHHVFIVESNATSSNSPISLLILTNLNLADKFLCSVINSILTAAFISAYCVWYYQENATSSTSTYKDINFFKIFYTKYLGSMCCSGVLPVLVRCIQIFFHLIGLEYGSTVENCLTSFHLLFDIFMSSAEICVFVYMATSGAGYFQGLKYLNNVFRQKRWYMIKNTLLITFSVFVLLIIMSTGEGLFAAACDILISLFSKEDYSLPDELGFLGGTAVLAEMVHTLAVSRFFLPILLDKGPEMIMQESSINLQNIEVNSQELPESV